MSADDSVRLSAPIGTTPVVGANADIAKIIEVLPRDGLQVLPVDTETMPSTAQKLDLVSRLVSAGLRHVEVTSFAHPGVLPQFADAEAVVRGLPMADGVDYQVLVPNLRGAQRAVAAGGQHLSCLIVASETYQQQNSGLTVRQGLEQIDALCSVARSAGAVVTATIGTSFWCPYEGRISETAVTAIIDRLVDFGIRMVVLADSIGCADPEQVERLITFLKVRYPNLSIGVHLHDFTGLALTNLYVAWKAGANVFESSVAGIGGGIRMPVATKHMGNIATEDVVQLLQRCGVETGIDLDRLRQVAMWAAELLGQSVASRLSRGGTVEEFLANGRNALGK